MATLKRYSEKAEQTVRRLILTGATQTVRPPKIRYVIVKCTHGGVLVGVSVAYDPILFVDTHLKY